jgi:hypothetical protein
VLFVFALAFVFAPAAGAAPLAPVASWTEITAGGELLSPGPLPRWQSVVPSGVHAVALAVTRDGLRAWVAGADGGVFAVTGSNVGGTRQPTTGFFGSLPSMELSPRGQVVGIAATPDGRGYWLVGSDGGVFAFGNARFFGSLGAAARGRIVGIAATPDGGGYWLVGSDGGVFAFGDARYLGSLPGKRITSLGNIVGFAATIDGRGYWLAASDGAVFAFGDALFLGRDQRSVDPVVAIVAAPRGSGYGFVHRDARVVGFGSMPSGGVCTNVAVFSPVIVSASAYPARSRVCNA